MKRRLLVAAVLLLSCAGCVGYYRDPYVYDPYYPYYPYSPYYAYPGYWPPAAYYDPGWSIFYPSFYFGYSHHDHGGYYHHGHGGRH